VGDLWIARARTSIRDDAPYALTSYLDSRDAELAARAGVLEWAEEQGFRCLWELQHEFGATVSQELEVGFRVFCDTEMRSVMGMLLLSRSEDQEIASTFQEKFLLDVGAALELYKALFWDVTLLSKERWSSFIEELSTKEEQHHLGLGLEAPTSDETRSAVGLPPTQQTPDNILDDILSRSYERYLYLMTQTADPEQAGVLRWIDSIHRTINTLQGSVAEHASKAQGE
jgi:hypothetical protein